MATLVHGTLCATLSGLSKVYRACGYRVGWVVFSGRTHAAADYLQALELLSSLRLCSNVLAQWAVQTALGGYQSIRELVAPAGRLYESRATIMNATPRQPLPQARAARRGDVRLSRAWDTQVLPDFDDQQFTLDLLEQKHVLVGCPGSASTCRTATTSASPICPMLRCLREVFTRIEELLAGYASTTRRRPRPRRPARSSTAVASSDLW